jgi:hypothetical protein
MNFIQCLRQNNDIQSTYKYGLLEKDIEETSAILDSVEYKSQFKKYNEHVKNNHDIEILNEQLSKIRLGYNHAAYYVDFDGNIELAKNKFNLAIE